MEHDLKIQTQKSFVMVCIQEIRNTCCFSCIANWNLMAWKINVLCVGHQWQRQSYISKYSKHHQLSRMLNISLNTNSNQIKVDVFNVPRLTQASLLQKKANVSKCFFDICNAEMAQSLSNLQKSECVNLRFKIFY